MLLQQAGNGKRNGQFSELLISSGDTLRGGGGGGWIRELQSFVSGPQCSARLGEGHLSASGDLFANEISLLY